MYRNSKSLFTSIGMTFSGLAAVAILSVSQISMDDRSAFCAHIENIVFDKELPVSHPTNKCANEQPNGVSWSAWFSGRSSSYPFHFIDLLELLSRSGNSEAKNPTKTN